MTSSHRRSLVRSVPCAKTDSCANSATSFVAEQELCFLCSRCTSMRNSKLYVMYFFSNTKHYDTHDTLGHAADLCIEGQLHYYDCNAGVMVKHPLSYAALALTLGCMVHVSQHQKVPMLQVAPLDRQYAHQSISYSTKPSYELLISTVSHSNVLEHTSSFVPMKNLRSSFCVQMIKHSAYDSAPET